MEAMGPALPPGFGSRYEPTGQFEPREAYWETGAGGWENGYIGDGQAANRKCTSKPEMHCTHTPQNTGSSPGPGWPAVEPSLLLFWDACLTDPMGGVGL